MYSSYLRQSQRRMFEVRGVSPPAVPSITPGEGGSHITGEQESHITGEGSSHIARERGANTPTITVTTSSPIPATPTSSPSLESYPPPSIPIILEPSRVEGSTSPVSISLQPPSLKGKLPPVASASQTQTVFDGNGIFTITRPHSVVSQQPLTILPLREDSGAKLNNNSHVYTGHTDSSSKYDRVTLSSSGSDRSRSVVPVSSEDDDHTNTKREGCCERLCDSISVMCCLLCDCRCGHCDLCCLLCRICIAV